MSKPPYYQAATVLRAKIKELEKQQTKLYNTFLKEHGIDSGCLADDYLFDYVYNDGPKSHLDTETHPI